jgi:hypothetical protein
VYRSALQIKLEQGRQVVGLFAPAGADFATPGVLSWSVDGGAELELVDLTHPWPTDFDGALTIHGKPRDGEAITLLDARVRSKTFRDQTFLVGGRTLAQARASLGTTGGRERSSSRRPSTSGCPIPGCRFSAPTTP